MKFCSTVFTTLSQTIIPKDYEDYYGKLIYIITIKYVI